MNYPSQLRKVIRKNSWLTALLLVNIGIANAQTGHTIQGQLVDATTNQPLPYVTLSLANGVLSNETNKNGYFMLALPEQYKQDTLTFTALNYQRTQVPLRTLSPTNAVIQLKALVNSAQPATDTYFSLEQPFQARDTLLKAVAAIAKNYSNKPTLLHGFYRETITEQQPGLCVSYTEGLIDIYKPSYYFLKKEDKLYFIKGRRKPLHTFSIPVLTPGPWVSNMLDIVKYQEFLFHNGKLNTHYVFELVGQAAIGDQPVYIIDFKPRDPTVSTGYYRGKLFVATAGLAIIRAEYELSDQAISLLNSSGYAKIYSTRLYKRTYTATYTQFNERWSFQGGSVENTFSYTSTDLRFQSRIDLIVTRRQVDNVTSSAANELVNYKQLHLDLFDKTPATFWIGESYLVPMYPLPPLLTTTSP